MKLIHTIVWVTDTHLKPAWKGMYINHLQETILMVWSHSAWQAEEEYFGSGAGKESEKSYQSGGSKG